MNDDDTPHEPRAGFWLDTPLEEMTRREWESLCDGCGKCCLHKLEDEDSGAVFFTGVACRLLDTATCRCTRYDERARHVPECLMLTPASVRTSALPATCAYRLLAEGQALPAWHPLLSGDPQSTHRAGMSVCGRVVNEGPGIDPGQHLIVTDGF